MQRTRWQAIVVAAAVGIAVLFVAKLLIGGLYPLSSHGGELITLAAAAAWLLALLALAAIAALALFRGIPRGRR